MAVTVTVTATKIDVTSTGGNWETFDAVVTAVNAITPGTITGSGTAGDPYVVTVISGNREIEISSGCKVTFVSGTVVRWGTTTTASTYALDFANGSYVVIEDGCDIDSSGGTVSLYWSFYGNINITGTSGSRVTLGGYTRLYMYMNTDVGDCVWEYFDMANPRAGTSYAFYLSGQTSTGFQTDVTFREFTITGYTYGLSFQPGGMYGNLHFSDFVIDACSYGIAVNGTSCKVMDGVIQNCPTRGIDLNNSGNVISAAYETAQDDTRFPTGRFQSMAVFENIHLIDNDNGVYHVYADLNSLAFFKNCTFEGVTYSGTQDGVYSGTGAVVIQEGTTWTNMHVKRVWATDGTHLHGRSFAITVQDENGDPVVDATVSWVQGSSPSKERWATTTDANGQIKSVFGDDPVFIEKEETATDTFEDWTTDGLKVVVSKHGYKKFEAVYTMDSAKSVVVTLKKDYPKVQIDQEVI